MLNNNDKYQVAFTSEVHNVDFYIPKDASTYHLSRRIAASGQDIYSQSGVTKETLIALLDRMLEGVNKEKNDANFRSDVATICNNLKYRTNYPVDEQCGVRMGAILCFHQDENPDETLDFWTQKKMTLAMGDGVKIKPDPKLYAFFLSMGIEFTPSYADLLTILDENKEYFQTRMDNLRSLTPSNL